MTIQSLADARGLSYSTAKRYLKAGIDLRDAKAVDQHKQKLRTRFLVGRRSKRLLVTVTKNTTDEPSPFEALWDTVSFQNYWLKKLRDEHPGVAKQLNPIIDRLSRALA